MRDWHMHTVVSDGFNTAPDMLKKVRELGIESISITDHDAVDAYFALDADFTDGISLIDGITVTTGVELDCTIGALSIEILGYGFDLHSKQLNDYLSKIQGMRKIRAGNYISEINTSLGVNALHESDVFVPSRKTILKPHLLRPLIDAGIFSSYKEAKSFIAKLKDTDIDRINAFDAINMIHSAGGTAYLAHPGVYDFDFDTLRHILSELQMARIDGIEFFYPYLNMHDARYPSLGVVNAFLDKLLSVCPDFKLSHGSDSHSIKDLAAYWM